MQMVWTRSRISMDIQKFHRNPSKYPGKQSMLVMFGEVTSDKRAR